MKSRAYQKRASSSYLLLASLVAAVCGLVGFAGCASMEAASQESLLKSAGFQERTPSTPKQKAAYDALPAYQLHRGTLKGRTAYVYKDEKAGVVYIGHKAQYQQFQQLAAKAKLKEEKQVAHDLDNDLEYRWYGSWKDFGDQSPVD
jgi:hypothetical protein